MNSSLAWLVFAAVAVTLAAVGCLFSIRTLRWVAFAIALAIVAYLPLYGLTHPAGKPGSLSDAFARGADTLSGALIRPLSFGHQVPVPGRIGWLVIVVLLVLGYRGLEAWTLHRQAPSLDVSALASDRQDDAEPDVAETGTERQHEWLVAELKFRLPAVEVRSPAILPGGSRPSGLASIVEASGVNGAGLVGAIIQFFAMVWPNPPRIQVRAWVERATGQAAVVTVGLADPASGANIATKTLAARNLDDAADAVAGYVARHIFARDRTVPPWSASATDGADLGALLRARQVRGYPERRDNLRVAWDRQIEILEGVARANLCAGVVRYELAQLYDLTGRHVEALLLHAVNREQYPRFYRGRYRLAMSLEMLANPHAGFAEIDNTVLRDALRLLGRCGVIDDDKLADKVRQGDQAGLLDLLRPQLLAAARRELEAIQRYLTWRHIIWGLFWPRNERGVIRPYRHPRHRQAFHDGVCVALLLVAVRQALDSGAAAGKLRHAGLISRIAAAISGDSADFASVLRRFPARAAGQRPAGPRLRTRRWPWQRSTPSWPAAYNLACAYAALAADAAPVHLVTKAVRSLEFAVCNPECEMERPSEWIGNDPDFGALCRGKHEPFTGFLDEQRRRDYPADG
jgi:hypothetical protein